MLERLGNFFNQIEVELECIFVVLFALLLTITILFEEWLIALLNFSFLLYSVNGLVIAVINRSKRKANEDNKPD